MDSKVYKSSRFKCILYGATSAIALSPCLWIMLYGLDKRKYGIYMFILGAMLCSYLLYILEKTFLYKVVLRENTIEIYDLNSCSEIPYKDILDIRIEKDACYIIDTIRNNGRDLIRGTNICTDTLLLNDEFSVDAGRLISIQRAYLEDFDGLVDEVLKRCARENISIIKKYIDASDFISTALLRKTNQVDANIKDILSVLFPYFMLMLILVMTLISYSVYIKGKSFDQIHIAVNLVFPVFVVICGYILTIKFSIYTKKIIAIGKLNEGVSRKAAITYIMIDTVASLLVILLFFYVRSKMIMG